MAGSITSMLVTILLAKKFYNKETKEKNHIGMENAITRIYMYYGECAKVQIESEEGSFTRISICIPVERDNV